MNIKLSEYLIFFIFIHTILDNILNIIINRLFSKFFIKKRVNFLFDGSICLGFFSNVLHYFWLGKVRQAPPPNTPLIITLKLEKPCIKSWLSKYKWLPIIIFWNAFSFSHNFHDKWPKAETWCQGVHFFKELFHFDCFENNKEADKKVLNGKKGLTAWKNTIF